MKQPSPQPSKGNVELCKRQLREVAQFQPRRKLQSEARSCVKALDRKRQMKLRPWVIRKRRTLVKSLDKAPSEQTVRWLVVLEATLDAIDALEKAD